MKNNIIKIILASVFTTILLLGGFSAYADDATQTTLNPFSVVAGYIKSRSATNGLQVTSLANKSCLGTDSTGKFGTGTCSGGGGSGTISTSTNAQIDKVARWTGPATLGNGALIDNGTIAGINASSSTITFNIQGNAGAFDPFNVASSSGTSYLRVTQAGNIGIGTTTPQDIVEIANGLPNERITITNNAVGNIFGGIRFGNTSNTAGDYTGEIGSFTFTGNNYTTAGDFAANDMAFQYFGTDKMIFVNRQSAVMDFLINGFTSAARAMYIDTNKNIYLGLNGGNVGIGTTTPAQPLVVVGSTTITSLGAGCVNSTSFGGLYVATCASGSGSSGGVGTTSPFSAGYVPEATGTNVTLSNSNLFQDTTGNFGIGTINPTAVNANAKLTVSGAGSQDYVASTTDNTTLSDAIYNAYAVGSRIFMGAHGSAQITTQYGITVGGWGELGALNSSSGSSNGLLIGTRTTATPIVFGTNSGERMRILSGGQVLVGTSTPTTANLFLQGSTTSANILTVASSSGISMLSVNANNTINLQNEATPSILNKLVTVFGSQTGGIMRVARDTGTGILPSQIYGTYDIAAYTGSTTITTFPNFSGAAQTFSIATSTGINIIGAVEAVRDGNDTSGDIFLAPYSNGVAGIALTALPNLNIGIGTTTPQQNLVVVGSTTIASLGAGCVNSTANGGLFVATCASGGGVTGGTNGYNARWTSATTLSTGELIDDGTVVGVNASSSTVSLNVQGSGTLNPFNVASSSGNSIFKISSNQSSQFALDATTTAAGTLTASTTPTVLLGSGTLVAGSSNGTYLGANANNGFTGNFIDFQKGASNSVFKVASSGAITASTLTSTAGNGETINGNQTITGGDVILQSNNSRGISSNSTEVIIATNGKSINPTSGSATWAALEVDGSAINQTVSASGISRGVLISPTVTKAADFRVFEIAPYTYNLAAATPVNSTLYGSLFNSYTLASSTAATVTSASLITLTGAPKASGGAAAMTIASSTALTILGNNVTASTTNSYSAYFVANTGAANNYGLGLVGDFQTIGGAPTLTSCGTSPTIRGTDTAGEVTVGSVSATGCTISWTSTKAFAPSCTITNQSMSVVNAMTYTISTTALTVSQTGLTGDKLNYQCTQLNN